VQNPVAHFPVDNNGTLIALPALPKLGALVAKGRLVFGIGTQLNNQLPLSVTQVFVDPNPNNPGYLYQGTTVGAASYPFSYIDSGSNGLFFHDTGIAQGCQASAGQSAGGWYCPAATLDRSATITDVYGTAAPVSFSIANADTLFATTGTAFANLGGDVTSAPETFVWGLSFFFGRTVDTSIWYQQLSPNGPWNAF